MSTTLVSIVSEQTSPNLLFIREKPDVDNYLFISTERMESEHKTLHLRTAAGIPEERTKIIVVEQNSLDDVQKKLGKVKFKDDEHFLVNITGGTKLMSIGVYTFFREKSSEMFYLGIELTKTYLKVFPIVKNKEFSITHRLTLWEYLTSYGIEIINLEKVNKMTRPSEETIRFFAAFRTFADEDWQVLAALRERRNLMRREKKKPVEAEYERFFRERWHFNLTEKGFLSKEEIDYLTGGWFEEYVYHWMKSYLRLEDKYIGMNLQIKRSGVANEFDVLFMYENTPFLIECKTSIWDSLGKKDIMNDTLYKLEALSLSFGLRVKPYIFTLAQRGEEKHQIRQHHLDRARSLRVDVVDASIIFDSDKRAELIGRIKK